MTKLYKLATLDSKTYNQTQWGESITHTTPIRDTYSLCSSEVLHAYVSPEMAVLMDPVQAALLPSAILWECEGDVVIDDGTKVGCTSLTTLRQVSLPVITLEQRVTFAIRCAMRVYKDAAWTAWAQAWLDGTNRAAYTAYTANAANAAYAAYAAADAANTAYAANAAYAAYAAANTAYAAYAAYAAANAANAANAAANTGFIAQIAKEICQ